MEAVDSAARGNLRRLLQVHPTAIDGKVERRDRLRI